MLCIKWYFFWNIVLVIFRQIWYISDSLKVLRTIPMRFLTQLLHTRRNIMILIISSNRCLCSIFKKPWNTILLEHFETQYQLLLEKSAISYQLISWSGNFVEKHSFRIVSGDSPETIRELCLFTKFPHQEIR